MATKGPAQKVWNWTTANPGKALAVAGSTYLVSVLLGKTIGALTAAVAAAYVAGNGGRCAK